MKTTISLLGVGAILAGSLFAGPETIIRQRAKELSNQNNVRQGVASPATSAQPAPAPSPVSGQAAGVGRLPTDLAAIRLNAPVPLVQNQLITQDLMAIAGVTKVSSATAAKLARGMSEALSTKTFSPADRARLVQDLNAALGTPNLPPLQMQAVLADIQAIFQSNGLPRTSAVAIVDSVKAMSAEVLKNSAK